MSRRLVALLAAVLILSAAVVLPASAEPPSGFVMTGADAAYAEFDVAVDGCVARLFVGYVEADRFKYFGGGIVKPHSDVAVALVGCGLDLEGVAPSVGSPLVDMVELDSASLDGFVVPLTGGSVAVVTLDWTAVGDVWTWTDHGPGKHASHRTRAADVTGTVTIDTVGLSLTADADRTVITHYREIQIELP